jgi:hypothetical protein
VEFIFFHRLILFNMEELKEKSLFSGLLLSFFPMIVILIFEYIIITKYNFKRDARILAEYKISWILFSFTYPIIYIKLINWRSFVRYFVFITLVLLLSIGRGICAEQHFSKLNPIVELLIYCLFNIIDITSFTLFLLVISNLILKTKFSFVVILRIISIAFMFNVYGLNFNILGDDKISVSSTLNFDSISLFVIGTCLLLEAIKVQNLCKTRHLLYFQIFTIFFGLSAVFYWNTFLKKCEFEKNNILQKNSVEVNYCI